MEPTPAARPRTMMAAETKRPAASAPTITSPPVSGSMTAGTNRATKLRL
jgi:hypothetical protein